MSLDVDSTTFRTWLNIAVDEVVRFHDALGEAPASRRPDEGGLEYFDGPCPRSPESVESIIGGLREQLLAATSVSSSSRFFGYIVSSGTQLGIVADIFKTGLNLCPSKWDVSASATEIERSVVRWIAEFIGLPSDTAGTLVSGGTMANLTALAAARAHQVGVDVGCTGVYSIPHMLAYTSEESHFCHDLSMDVLGLGRNQLKRVPVNLDYSIDCEELDRQITDDLNSGYRPFCVIGSAGTTNTGAVDDLENLADICARHQLWFHVDGAYGAPAAMAPAARHLFAGLDRADSIAVDPHKWLFAPLGVGCILIRQWESLRHVFKIDSDYLHTKTEPQGHVRHNWIDYTLETTQEFRALKIWLAFRGYGADRILKEIDENIVLMHELARQIEDADDLELLAPVPLSTVCFRYRPPNPDSHINSKYLNRLNVQLRQAIAEDGRIYLPGTRIRGQEALRACSVNHRATTNDTDELLLVVRELGEKLSRECRSVPKLS